MTEQEREKINNYIKEFSENWQFTYKETIEKEIFGVSIHIEAMVYRGEDCSSQKAHVVLQKGELRYECDFVDEHKWEETFIPLELEGVRYLCFRKTLYGFSLLNVDTFEEEEFFPFEVIDGEESYIFVDAISFHEFIVFDGCYWGTSYFYYIYDSKTKKFLDTHEEYKMVSVHEGMSVSENRLKLVGEKEDEQVTITLSREELKKLMEEKGQDNFYL